MEHLRHIRDFDQMKLLSDSRRLTILRLLMAEPATLTQLGEILDEHPARVRHHVKLLEQAGLVEQVETRVVRGFIEKYYRSRARAFALQQIILPASAENHRVTVMGSHDLALELLAVKLRDARQPSLDLFTLPVGSMEGLVALRQGQAQIAGCHLFDPESGEYNLSFVRHLFPDRQIGLVTLAHRQQGLIVAPGNPLGLRGVADLARPGVLLINRNRGSGTRLWLDQQLKQLGLAAGQINGYEREVRTHTAAAEVVRSGRAGVSIGLLAAAQRLDLEFVPLFEERFDLALSLADMDSALLQPLFERLAEADFLRQVEALGGYSTRCTGERRFP
ncbi:MAG: substrate-binding domain-containing protein [Chloroflexota bacterium]